MASLFSMPTARMNPGEVDVAPSLVRRLVATQFPQWAGLPLARVSSAGTDNAAIGSYAMAETTADYRRTG